MHNDSANFCVFTRCFPIDNNETVFLFSPTIFHWQHPSSLEGVHLGGGQGIRGVDGFTIPAPGEGFTPTICATLTLHPLRGWCSTNANPPVSRKGELLFFFLRNQFAEAGLGYHPLHKVK